MSIPCHKTGTFASHDTFVDYNERSTDKGTSEQQRRRFVADYVPTFLGSVMKAIACTPNKNFDNAAYEKGVIEPARKIRKLQEELGDARPSDEQMKEVMAYLLTIFETKMVDHDEREDRIKEILDRNHLHALFPDLLPLKK
ncbi:MAG: hypothetical protein U1D30_25425 [Planctomycetota bacterium]